MSLFVRVLFLICPIVGLTIAQSPTGDYLQNGKMNRIDMYCGPNCLWQIATVYNKDVSLRELATIAETSGHRGTSMAGMVRAATAIGLHAKAVKTNIDELCNSKQIPVLLLTSNSAKHYVILDSVSESSVRILDQTEFVTFSKARLDSLWDGHAILISSDSYTSEVVRLDFLGISIITAGAIGLIIVGVYAFWFRKQKIRGNNESDMERP